MISNTEPCRELDDNEELILFEASPELRNGQYTSNNQHDDDSIGMPYFSI